MLLSGLLARFELILTVASGGVLSQLVGTALRRGEATNNPHAKETFEEMSVRPVTEHRRSGVGEKSPLHSSSGLRNEIKTENLIGLAGRRHLHRGSPGW